MSPRTYLSAAARRGQVLERAAELFAAQGFHATSVDDIARAAGLSPGGLYRHFEGKRAVITAIVAEDARLSAERVAAAVDAAHDPGAALDALVDAHLAPLATPADAALRAEIVAEAARDAGVAEAVAAHDDALAALTRRVVTAAARPGSHAATDLESAIELLAVVLDGIALRCAVHGSFEPAWSGLARHVAHGLVAGGAR